MFKEQEAAAKEVAAWRGQIEMMQIDASSFETAAKRLSRANNSIIQAVLKSYDQLSALYISKEHLIASFRSYKKRLAEQTATKLGYPCRALDCPVHVLRIL